MNQLTSFQRKIAYLVMIVLLLPLIIWLGKPASRGADGDLTSGGKLATMRTTHRLGETSLGDVDPSSTTMNLVLLGFRGIATNLLWQKAIEEREHKQWAALRSTVNSIIKLQPHYIKVWDFQGWNLAYNVSAEWDNVPDRWYWVKEGGKFYMRGTRRNNQNAELTHLTGQLVSQKVGRSDERTYFRNYFLDDPNDELFGDGPDSEFNRGYDDPGPYSDNYLAARDWFVEANRREKSYPQTSLGMQLEHFRSYPANSYLKMASALQREGQFGLKSRKAWELGHQAWTQGFGMHSFPSELGNYHLEITDDRVFEEIADRNSRKLGKTISADMIQNMVMRRQNVTNYRYWRMRSLVEMDPKTVEAHRNIYQGQQLYQQGRMEEAAAKLRDGLAALEEIFGEHKAFKTDELITEEVLMAMVYLESIHSILTPDGKLPEDTPLYEEFWVPVQGQPVMKSLYRRFQNDTNITGAG